MAPFVASEWVRSHRHDWLINLAIRTASGPTGGTSDAQSHLHLENLTPFRNIEGVTGASQGIDSGILSCEPVLSSEPPMSHAPRQRIALRREIDAPEMGLRMLAHN